MHIDPTLAILSHVTTSLGNSLRDFEDKTCKMFKTRELEREQAARKCRQEKKMANNGGSSKSAAAGDNTRKSKHLNLNTYKVHALGDYVTTIEQYGTTDSYSTQAVSIHTNL
jgi:hypothetical protein